PHRPAPPATRRRAAGVADTTGSLRARLATQPATERIRTLIHLIQDHTATVLGHPDTATVDTHHTFRELGFDSLTAVEFRNRLATATGLRLPVTLGFDHPTPTRLVAYLSSELAPVEQSPAERIRHELDRLETDLELVSADDP